MLSGARLSRLCESCRSHSWSQSFQDCWNCAWRCTQCSVARLYHKMFVNFRSRIYCIYKFGSEQVQRRSIVGWSARVQADLSNHRVVSAPWASHARFAATCGRIAVLLALLSRIERRMSQFCPWQCAQLFLRQNSHALWNSGRRLEQCPTSQANSGLSDYKVIPDCCSRKSLSVSIEQHVRPLRCSCSRPWEMLQTQFRSANHLDKDDSLVLHEVQISHQSPCTIRVYHIFWRHWVTPDALTLAIAHDEHRKCIVRSVLVLPKEPVIHGDSKHLLCLLRLRVDLWNFWTSLQLFCLLDHILVSESIRSHGTRSISTHHFPLRWWQGLRVNLPIVWARVIHLRVNRIRTQISSFVGPHCCWACFWIRSQVCQSRWLYLSRR